MPARNSDSEVNRPHSLCTSDSEVNRPTPSVYKWLRSQLPTPSVYKWFRSQSPTPSVCKFNSNSCWSAFSDLVKTRRDISTIRTKSKEQTTSKLLRKPSALTMCIVHARFQVNASRTNKVYLFCPSLFPTLSLLPLNLSIPFSSKHFLFSFSSTPYASCL